MAIFISESNACVGIVKNNSAKAELYKSVSSCVEQNLSGARTSKVGSSASLEKDVRSAGPEPRDSSSDPHQLGKNGAPERHGSSDGLKRHV